MTADDNGDALGALGRVRASGADHPSIRKALHVPAMDCTHPLQCITLMPVWWNRRGRRAEGREPPVHREGGRSRGRGSDSVFPSTGGGHRPATARSTGDGGCST